LASVFATHLLDAGTIEQRPEGVAFGVRLPWYRSLPLSVVDIVAVKIDGAPVSRERLRIEVNGRIYGAGDLAERIEEIWYVLDSALLHVDVGSLPPSTTHSVDLTLTLYPPYIPGLPWVTRATRTFHV
jgi:Domain of unknown function (DUF6379)